MKLAAIATTMFCACAASAGAAELFVPAGHGVAISFDLPKQPAEYDGFFMFAGFTVLNDTVVETELFDETSLLARTVGSYVFPVFADSTSVQSGKPYAVDFDFSRLADGAFGAKLVLTVLDSVSGAFLEFEPADLKGQGFGNSGSYLGYDAVITGVMPFAAAVPEPDVACLFALGLFGVAAARRSKAGRTLPAA